jgi:uncharacterized protein YbbC (DUF1343 family)
MIAILLLLAMQPTTLPHPATPDHLWRLWPEQRFVELDAPCLRHAHVVGEIERLLAVHAGAVEAGLLAAEPIGYSVEGRSIHLLSVGRGPFEVLLWSQMHGDEPSATPALFDLAHHLLTHRDSPGVAAILDRLTLRMIPMLNPDGAEHYQRRNAQGIDINRDALRLSTPEGRLLRAIRDRYQPALGFNLHDQNRRNVVGDTGVLATNAVLAVAGDEAGTVTAGRRRAMRACSAIVASLTPFTAGGVARYDEDWSPRAFGDNLTAWGTPIVLLESGAAPDGGDLAQLTRLNFVALAAVLGDLAADDLAGHDPKLYEELPRNRSDAWADRLLRGARLLQPGLEPFGADVAWNLERPERAHACVAPADARSRIVELGDASVFGATEVVATERALLVPAFAVGADGWKARRWLDGAALETLAAWGVDRVVWRVPPSRRHAAETVVRALDGDRRARLELTVERERLPPVLLSAAPGGRPPAALSAHIAGLLGEPTATRPGLDRLAAEAPIRVGGRASFLLVEPAGDAGPDGDFQDGRVERVWIDGIEVTGATVVRTGLDRVASGEVELPAGRVGLIAHAASVTHGGVHAIDVLRARGVELVRLFGPEHGLRGTAAAGEAVGGGVDAASGLPVVSLYGAQRQPGAHDLADLDVLVVDLQDAGVRFYTYVSTLMLSLEAAAEHGVTLVVLDRPNPLGGERVEGPPSAPRDEVAASFVNMAPGPLVHGLTLGEFARLHNARLERPAELVVVEMTGWRRSMSWLDTGLDWVAPSPNLRTAEAALAYPGTALLEATTVSEGRGTDAPFLTLGAPGLDAERLARKLETLGIGRFGFAARPIRFTPAGSAAAPDPKHEGVECAGLAVSVTDPQRASPYRLGLALLVALRDEEGFAWRGDGWLARLTGDAGLAAAVDAGATAEELWRRDAAAHAEWRHARAPFLLYAD